MDIISFNRYNAWYQNAGHLDMITGNVVDEATAWFEKYNKPVLMSEYGADTMEGLHIVRKSVRQCNLLSLFIVFQYPAFIWSEEFQVKMMSKHFEAFDLLREKGFFIGEFIWNFADFKTAQSRFNFHMVSITVPIFIFQRTPESVATRKVFSPGTGNPKPVRTIYVKDT